MVRVWTFARLTLLEASRSRLLAIGLGLTVAYLALVGWGESKIVGSLNSPVLALSAGISVEVMAFFLGSFMLALLAVFISGHSVHQEGESGLLQAILAKPIRRIDVLAGRWLGSALLLAGWVVLFTAGVVLEVGLQIGYYPPHPLRAAALLLLLALVMLSLRLLFGSFLGTLASGILPLLLFGLGWMGGMVETVGRAIHLSSLVNAGIAASLVVPTDALWRGASANLLPPLAAVASTVGAPDPARGIPFVSLDPIAGPMVAWALLYAAGMFLCGARVFSRRDV